MCHMQQTDARASLNEAIAAEIRAELGRRGMSQAQLAIRIGWTKETLARRLRSFTERGFSISELEQIAEALDITVIDLIAEAG